MVTVATNRLLGGRYRLVERLGAGGMSVVWRGYDEALGRPVAIKLLTAERLAHAGSRERIRTEARAAARLSHPHITSVHDYGEAHTGSGPPTPYVVMELLSGSTLADRLRDGPLPVRKALQVCAQVASALAAAHGSGLVHRDVKPGNVMLTPTGAKVLDFGLAAAAGAPDESRSDGQVWGTPAYLAPERLTADRVEPASDVYALGLLLFAALTGGRPWRADTVPQLLHAHRFEPPSPLPPIPELPDPVAQLCHRCLAKDAVDRPAAHQVARVLAEAVGWRVSSVVPPRTGSVPDRLAAVYTQRLVRVAAPEVTVAVDGSGTGPAGDGQPAEPGRRGSLGRWRSLALTGAAAAVLGSLSAGLWPVGEPPARLGLAGPGAVGLGTAVPTPAGSDPAPGDPAPGDPAATRGSEPGAGSGPDGGSAGGVGTEPTGGARPTAGATAGTPPTSSPEPSGSATPPPTEPPSSGPGSPAPSGSPTPDQPPDDPPEDPPDSPASPAPSAAASPLPTP